IELRILGGGALALTLHRLGLFGEYPQRVAYGRPAVLGDPPLVLRVLHRLLRLDDLRRYRWLWRGVCLFERVEYCVAIVRKKTDRQIAKGEPLATGLIGDRGLDNELRLAASRGHHGNEGRNKHEETLHRQLQR